MRYTTLIDISEFPSLYENPKIRLVYLHLALKAGHQPYNKGFYITTYTRLSNEIGVTVASIRWAFAKLQAFKVIKVTIIKAKYHKQIKIYVGKRVNKDQQVTT